MINPTTSRPLRVAVIIGSTREGRRGAHIGDWLTAAARERENLAVEVVDLDRFDFPARHPAQPGPEVRAFTGRIDAAEAFVVVTPEYNRSFPASLKQAIDFAYDEWHAKPVGFVSYGCHCEGLHAVEQLRSIFTELHTVPVRDSVGIDLLRRGEYANPAGTPEQRRAADALLDQLTWWGLALRAARAASPYVS